MKIKGWDALYLDNPADQPGLKPLPGTDAHLAWVAEQKKHSRKQVKIKDGGTRSSDSPKVSLRKKKRTPPPRIPDHTPPSYPPRIPDESQPSHPRRIPVPSASPDEGADLRAQVTSNLMQFDLSIFDILPTLSEGEMRVYLDLIRRTYGQSPPCSTCEATRRQIGEAAGVASPNAQISIIQRLEDRGLVQRLTTSKGKHQQSQFRVVLPRDLSDSATGPKGRHRTRNASS